MAGKGEDLSLPDNHQRSNLSLLNPVYCSLYHSGPIQLTGASRAPKEHTSPTVSSCSSKKHLRPSWILVVVSSSSVGKWPVSQYPDHVRRELIPAREAPPRRQLP
jgi:hypothetical protein